MILWRTSCWWTPSNRKTQKSRPRLSSTDITRGGTESVSSDAPVLAAPLAACRLVGGNVSFHPQHHEWKINILTVDLLCKGSITVGPHIWLIWLSFLFFLCRHEGETMWGPLRPAAFKQVQSRFPATQSSLQLYRLPLISCSYFVTFALPPAESASWRWRKRTRSSATGDKSKASTTKSATAAVDSTTKCPESQRG